MLAVGTQTMWLWFSTLQLLEKKDNSPTGEESSDLTNFSGALAAAAPRPLWVPAVIISHALWGFPPPGAFGVLLALRSHQAGSTNCSAALATADPQQPDSPLTCEDPSSAAPSLDQQF